MSGTVDGPPASSSPGAAPPPYVPPCGVCQVTGAATFTGVAGYLLYQRSLVERSARTHRGVLLAMSGAFVVAAAARLRY
jgi:hypothetical protein